MNKAVLESESKERFRIARDLHDSVGQMLSVIKMHLSNSSENNALGEIVDKTISEVRSISHNLIPEALNFGLKRALEELIDKTNLDGKVEVSLIFEIEKSNLRLSQEKELMLFRIIQELIGNTLKHANATVIQLNFQLNHDQLEVLIVENGIGFDLNKIDESKGLGWKNTYARLALISGVITISSEKNKGSKIKIIIPNV
jgi:two-component system NarL family sensor kinase